MTQILETLYKKVAKPIFFRMDPEDVHNHATRIGRILGSNPFGRSTIRGLCQFKHHALNTTVAGIHFENPIGLAAGFDKNAQLWKILPEVGFGFAELGSITGEPCAGNPRPRLFRLPEDKSIIVNYGLYNKGCEEISKRLAHATFQIPIGFSVAKTNDPRLNRETGIKDYVKAYTFMHPLGSYTTINVSCPNTSDGQTFGHPENLAPLLKTIDREPHTKPIFIKLKPDMNDSQLKEIIEITNNYSWLTGFIMGNLTVHREGLTKSKEELDNLPPGGLSGGPTKERSNHCITFFHKHSDKIIIGCGGIFSGKDAYEKLKLGASLIQMVSGLIYEGPGVVGKINRELVDLLQHDGYRSIKDVTPQKIV